MQHIHGSFHTIHQSNGLQPEASVYMVLGDLGGAPLWWMNLPSNGRAQPWWGGGGIGEGGSCIPPHPRPTS